MSKYYPPLFAEKQFNCLHCGVYANQNWHKVLYSKDPYNQYETGYAYCICGHCGERSLWKTQTKTLIDPVSTFHLQPHEDMPEEIKTLYIEASSVLDLSPKAGAALMRLALQNLMPLIGANIGKLDKDIAKLVADGMPEQIQQALDYCRVVGNNAVHPNELNLDDTPEMVTIMFEMINFIVEEKIAKPKRIAEMFSKLPKGAIDSITKRDSK